MPPVTSTKPPTTNAAPCFRRPAGIWPFSRIPKSKRCYSMKTVNLADLKLRLMTLYVCIPAMRLALCGRLFRLITQLTLAALEREATKPPHPVRLVLDEFAAFDRMTTLEKAIGQIAGLDCQLHI